MDLNVKKFAENHFKAHYTGSSLVFSGYTHLVASINCILGEPIRTQEILAEKGRLAWSRFTKEANSVTPPRIVERCWFAPEIGIGKGLWCAKLNMVGTQETYLDFDGQKMEHRLSNFF